MPRPRFVPTPEQRRIVHSMAAFGLLQEDIARCVGIRSAKTLRRHFREQLDRAAVEANARVAQTLYQMATSGKNAPASMFWLKARAGWRDHVVSFAPPSDPPPFIVMPEKKAA